MEIHDGYHEPMSEKVWTVAEAKARLSEILRQAREKGPQRIGTKKPYVVLTEEEWLKLKAPQPHMGQWLIKKLKGSGELELPDRNAPDRATPFEGFDEQ
jgi:prevent-host-death family protein